MSNYYIGKDRSPHIKHWKYIKRVRKNGKWVYYYDKEQLKDDLGFDEKAALDEAAQSWETNKAIKIIAEEERDKAAKSGDREYYNKMEAWNSKQQDKLLEVGAKYTDAKKAYMNTPLGKIDKATKPFQKAVKSVDKMFKKLFGKKKKKTIKVGSSVSKIK